VCFYPEIAVEIVSGKEIWDAAAGRAHPGGLATKKIEPPATRHFFANGKQQGVRNDGNRPQFEPKVSNRVQLGEPKIENSQDLRDLRPPRPSRPRPGPGPVPEKICAAGIPLRCRARPPRPWTTFSKSEQRNRATAQRWQNGQYDDVLPVHIDRIAENCWLNRSESTEIGKLKSQLAPPAAGPGRSHGALLRDPGTVKNFFLLPGRGRAGTAAGRGDTNPVLKKYC
jgi:hypothetical protein